MITTNLIETPHGPVTTLTEAPTQAADTVVLLAHGAGAGQAHPWMVAMREAIVGSGVSVTTFDYAYTEAGRKAPDRLPKLLDVHAAVGQAVASEGRSVVLVGKSMGGRVGGHLAAERGFGASGIVYLGYPLVAMGKAEPRDTSHLDELDCPQLFISGDRDRLGPIDLIAALAARVPDGRLVTVESGDHSLKPLKSSGRTVEDSILLAASEIAAICI